MRTQDGEGGGGPPIISKGNRLFGVWSVKLFFTVSPQTPVVCLPPPPPINIIVSGTDRVYICTHLQTFVCMRECMHLCTYVKN